MYVLEGRAEVPPFFFYHRTWTNTNFRNLSERCTRLCANPGSADLLCKAWSRCNCPTQITNSIWFCSRDDKLGSDPRHGRERGESLCSLLAFLVGFWVFACFVEDLCRSTSKQLLGLFKVVMSLPQICPKEREGHRWGCPHAPWQFSVLTRTIVSTP